MSTGTFAVIVDSSVVLRVSACVFSSNAAVLSCSACVRSSIICAMRFSVAASTPVSSSPATFVRCARLPRAKSIAS